MIFGTSRSISRKNSQFGGSHTLVIDLVDVEHLGVSAALSLEESILEMTRAGRTVYIVSNKGQALERLENLNILSKIPGENIVESRLSALKRIRDQYKIPLVGYVASSPI
jgi:sulfate permease, SulP family